MLWKKAFAIGKKYCKGKQESRPCRKPNTVRSDNYSRQA
jgi:hypothetical protein